MMFTSVKIQMPGANNFSCKRIMPRYSPNVDIRHTTQNRGPTVDTILYTSRATYIIDAASKLEIETREETSALTCNEVYVYIIMENCD